MSGIWLTDGLSYKFKLPNTLNNEQYISSGLQTLAQAGIEQRNLLVFEIGLRQNARTLVMQTLLHRDTLKSQGYVANPLSVFELFSLAFLFLRMGCLSSVEQAKFHLDNLLHRLGKYRRCYQKKPKL